MLCYIQINIFILTNIITKFRLSQYFEFKMYKLTLNVELFRVALKNTTVQKIIRNFKLSIYAYYQQLSNLLLLYLISHFLILTLIHLHVSYIKNN